MRLLPQAKLRLKEAIDKALVEHAGRLVSVLMTDYHPKGDTSRFRKGIENLIAAHAELTAMIDTWDSGEKQS